METNFPERTWPRQGSIIFCRTKDPFGHLSNMAAGYPLHDPETGLTFQSSEGLYQAAKFPGDPGRQRRIAAAPNAYAAKQIAYEADAQPAADWESRKVDAMRQALRAKLTQHPKFGALLKQTKGQTLVEFSSKGDRFWGAVTGSDPNALEGRNVLGILLSELRAEYLADPDSFRPEAQPDPAADPVETQTAPPAKQAKKPEAFPIPDFSAAVISRDQAMTAAVGGRTPEPKAAVAAVAATTTTPPARPATRTEPAATSQPVKLGNTRISSITSAMLLSPGNGFMSEYHGSLNPYTGCTFGCGYCYASNFTRDPKDQDTWGQWVQVKDNLNQLLDGVAPGAFNDEVIYMSTVTDPYQPIERKLENTRNVVRRLAEEHPRVRLVVQTRSPLAVRDADLFRQIVASGGKVQVNFTVTTDDEAIRKAYEPGCPSIPARLKAAAAMQNAEGVQTCITATPMLPLKDAKDFIRQLKETGVTRFIIQPFKLPVNAKGASQERFTARTDRKAIELTAQHYQLPADQAAKAYEQEYARNRALFKQPFPGIGEGKDGFQPPWPTRTKGAAAAAKWGRSPAASNHQATFLTPQNQTAESQPAKLTAAANGKKAVTLLVCGGRDYADNQALNSFLNELAKGQPIAQLIHGAASGADSLASQWAKAKGIPVKPFPADWKTHGKSAGYRRNEQMLQEGRPDLVVAFPGGMGTAHMLKIARQAGVTTQEAG